jgi:hypothetical protein
MGHSLPFGSFDQVVETLCQDVSTKQEGLFANRLSE